MVPRLPADAARRGPGSMPGTPRRTAMPTITCVMPARNAAGTVGTAVRTVLRALPEDGELLVRDDGSTDDTLGVLERIRDARLRVLVGPSVGIAAGMNTLLDEVTAPVVARMDADDVCAPFRFRRQLALLRSADLVFAPAVDWLPGTPVARPQPLRRLSAAAAPFALLLENPFMNPTMTARTRLIRDLGGCRSVASEDYDLWLRAAGAGLRLVRDRVPAVLYRRHPGQITAQSWWRAARADTELVHEAFDALALATVGFRPSWFAWRRAGLPAGGAPDGIGEELRRFRGAVAVLPAGQRRPLLRRIALMERRALLR
ncbi:polypeptide N-acetylgalactosaminyltransferase [Curtobacterium sp. MCBD17_013]|nr:polypeptide N-acetylgalactosaminyltransferase [Curtobacterium sp. MCBD17_013]